MVCWHAVAPLQPFGVCADLHVYDHQATQWAETHEMGRQSRRLQDLPLVLYYIHYGDNMTAMFKKSLCVVGNSHLNHQCPLDFSIYDGVVKVRAFGSSLPTQYAHIAIAVDHRLRGGIVEVF